MTAIAVRRYPDSVIMACDLAGSNSHTMTYIKTPKVFQAEGRLVGYTSSFRMGDLLRYSFAFPLSKPDMDEDTYMRTLFINALRDCFKAGGFAKIDSGVDNGGNLIVATKTGIYDVQSDFSVLTVRDDYHAVGSGAEVCLGAMAAGADPLTAVWAAEHHIATVGGGFTSLTLDLTA